MSQAPILPSAWPASPLRLVATATGAPSSAWLEPRPAVAGERRVAREVRAAALQGNLDPTDPRWILAGRTRDALQGAALTAERRQGLLRLAQRLHLRPFDANLIIAIVQDEARRRSPQPPFAAAMKEGDHRGSLSAAPSIPLHDSHLAQRLRIVPARDNCGDENSQRSRSTWMPWLAAAGLGALLCAAAIRWLLAP